MADECGNCGAKIVEASTFRTGNARKSPADVKIVNFFENGEYTDLCEKCGETLVYYSRKKISEQAGALKQKLQTNIENFPMYTVSTLPEGCRVKLKNMVTANVTVGTGFFNEFSQGVSDMFGAVNVSSGMSHKVNRGEAAARSILVEKALSMGANCILAVDIDYGVTGNNAATVNMQGTAVAVENLDIVMDEQERLGVEIIVEAYRQLLRLDRWRAGDFLD